MSDRDLRTNVLVAGYLAAGMSDDMALQKGREMAERIERALSRDAEGGGREADGEWAVWRCDGCGSTYLHDEWGEGTREHLNCQQRPRGAFHRVPPASPPPAEKRCEACAYPDAGSHMPGCRRGTGTAQPAEVDLAAPHYPGAPRPPKAPVCKCGQRMHLYGDPPKFAACGNPQCDAPRAPWRPAAVAPPATADPIRIEGAVHPNGRLCVAPGTQLKPGSIYMLRIIAPCPWIGSAVEPRAEAVDVCPHADEHMRCFQLLTRPGALYWCEDCGSIRVGVNNDWDPPGEHSKPAPPGEAATGKVE